MSFSYNCLTTNRKATLPSVEGWGTDLNILKDPPKSIHTRKIDKVSDTQDILYQINEGGDRICENINVYARGVNPSVSVSYANHGVYGGQIQNTLQSRDRHNQAFLPYRVARHGAFRPPILRQEDLYPLSRLPRIWTSAFTKPDFPNFAKKMECPESKKLREVKKEIIRTVIQPTAVSKRKNAFIKENFEITKVITNPVKYAVNSNIKHYDSSQKVNMIPNKEIEQNKHNFVMQSNISSNVRNNNKIDETSLDTSKYIDSNNLSSAVTSNINQNTNNSTMIPEQFNVSLREPLNHAVTSSIQGNDNSVSINDNIQLSRNLPNHTSRTNIISNLNKHGDNNLDFELERNRPLYQATTNIDGHGNIDVYNNTTRDAKLLPKVYRGSYKNLGTRRSQNRVSNVPENIETEKSNFNKKVFKAFMEKQSI